MVGFIGSNLAEHILKYTNYEIVGIDRLDFSGTLHRLTAIPNFDKYKHRITFVWHDLKAELNEYVCSKINKYGDIDLILHLAATTHVDRSIDNPRECVCDNIIGTLNMLEFARDYNIETFLYFSTDEVFGPAPPGVLYREEDRYNSGNPYAASKAGAEELCVSYANTYKIDMVITHTMNVIGPRQHPEKFIPSTIKKILAGQQVIIHGSKDLKTPGSRFYIHVEDVSRALFFILDCFTTGCQKFNIVGPEEVTNLEVAQTIADILNKNLDYKIVDFHNSRPGHDLRYALNGEKLQSMGFKRKYVSFKSIMFELVKWYNNNMEWL